MSFASLFSGLDGLSYCLELLLACLVFFLYLKKRPLFWLRMLPCLLVLFCAAKWIYPLFPQGGELWLSDIWYGLVYLLMIPICLFCCELSAADAVYCASCGYLLQHLASSVFILVVFNGSVPHWNGPLYYLVFVGVYAAVLFAIAPFLPESGEYRVSWTTALFTSAIALSITLILSTYVKATAPLTGDAVSSPEYIQLLKGSQIYAASICLVILILQVIQQRELRVQRNLDRNQNLWKQRQLQYETSKENIDLINRKVHDLKHQIAALAQSEGDSIRKKAFVSEVQNMIEVYDSDANTGNEALDTLLMEKGLYCHLHGIDWTCVADGKLLEHVDVVDLFTMLGNALDNAVEAVEKCSLEQYKSIAVRIWKRDLFTVIQVENSYNGEIVLLENGLPKSSKGDDDNHGFGTKSIRAIAEKYGGTVTVKTEEQVFTLTILLPVQ